MTKEVLWKRAWKVAATLGFAAASLGVRADGTLADYPRRGGETDDTARRRLGRTGRLSLTIEGRGGLSGEPSEIRWR